MGTTATSAGTNAFESEWLNEAEDLFYPGFSSQRRLYDPFFFAKIVTSFCSKRVEHTKLIFTVQHKHISENL